MSPNVPVRHVFSRGAAWQILPSGMWPHMGTAARFGTAAIGAAAAANMLVPLSLYHAGAELRRRRTVPPAPAGMPRCTKRCYCSAGDQALGSAPASSLSPRLPRTGVAAYFWLMSRHQKSFQQPFGVGRFASSPFRHAGPARISPRMGPLGGDPPGNAHGDRQLPAPRAHQPLRKRRPCGHPAGLPSQHKPDP